MEVNRAPYEMLLRVPGIGVKSAMRIVAARKQTALRFEDLKKDGSCVEAGGILHYLFRADDVPGADP